MFSKCSPSPFEQQSILFRKLYKSLLNISSKILFTVFLIALINSSVVVGFPE